MFFKSLAVVFLVTSSATGFAPAISHCSVNARPNTADPARRDSSVILFSDDKKKGGLDGSMRNKLLSESIAPWRTLRLFLYGSLGSGAFIGGLINTSGAIAGSNSPDFNLNTELLNVGIDFGAVALFLLLAKYDLGKQSELQTKVDEKMERKKELKQVTKSMDERQSILRSLNVEITISNDGATKTANVGELQVGAKQHVIIVAGPRKACRDALVGANLLKMDFAMSNVLVIPYETEAESTETQSRPSGGFGEKPIYERQPYIARPSGEDWDEYIKDEIADAVNQSGDSCKTEGIALVVANNGKVIRRGVGIVPWRQMVEQLDKEVNPSAQEGPLPWL